MKKAMTAVALACGVAFGGFAGDLDELGGIIMVPPQGKVVVFSGQRSLTEKDVRSFFLISDGVFELGYEFVPLALPFKMDEAPRLLAEAKGNAAIFLVDDPKLPMTVVALEEKWGLVNFAKLTADKPKVLTLGRRAEKLFTRVMTQVLGGGMGQEIPFSAMKPVFSVSDLDQMSAKAVSPAHLTQMSRYCQTLGLQHPMPMVYFEACERGLAPAPTNAAQKAIWDKVHQLPKTPIKIKPETTKVRE